MFTGAPSDGTLPLAIAYAQYVNCLAPKDGDSCGVCASCVKMAALQHPDLHFVFPVNAAQKSSGQKLLSDQFLPQWRELVARTGGYFDEGAWYEAIGIGNQQGNISRAEANEIVRKLSLKAFEGRYKIMLIWLPERMGEEAANGLLKILEEPWERTLFLLVSQRPQQLLPTIRSRVQQVAVPPVAENALRTKGNPEYFELFKQLMRLSYNDKHLELIEWAEAVAAMGREEQKRLLTYCVDLLRSSYMLSSGVGELAGVRGEEREFVGKFAPFITARNIAPLIAQMTLAAEQIARNGNPRIVFPHFALTISKMIERV